MDNQYATDYTTCGLEPGIPGDLWALANGANIYQALIIGNYQSRVDGHGDYLGYDLSDYQLAQIQALWDLGYTNADVVGHLTTILISTIADV